MARNAIMSGSPTQQRPDKTSSQTFSSSGSTSTSASASTSASDGEDPLDRHQDGLAGGTATVSLTLELRGFERPQDEGGELEGEKRNGGDDERAAQQRQPTLEKLPAEEDGKGGVRMVLRLPRTVDAGTSNRAADLLFEEIDRLPVVGVVERVEMSNLRFTPDGVAGFIVFLAIHADSVTHVSMNDIVGGGGSEHPRQPPTDCEHRAFEALIRAFEHSRLETIDLSNNTMGAYLWKSLKGQTELRQLLLDCVEMDDDSIQEWQRAVESGGLASSTLQHLHVVFARPLESRAALLAADAIVRSCTSLSSLRWINRKASANSKLPWIGLREMARAMFRKGSTRSLRNLVMSGGRIPTEDIQENGPLCAALMDLPRLQTLKLRNIGLDCDGAGHVVAALRNSRPHLECLDLSYNAISCEGAGHVATELSKLPKIVRSLRVLNLDHNAIGTEGARRVVRALGATAHPDLDLRLQENAGIRYGCVVFESAVAARRALGERDDLQRERERYQAEAADARERLRQLAAAQTEAIANVHILKGVVSKLTEERDALVKAFTVLGASQQAEEHLKTTERLAKLEEIVLGAAAATPGTSRSAPVAERTKNTERPAMDLSQQLSVKQQQQELLRKRMDMQPPQRRTIDGCEPIIAVDPLAACESPASRRGGTGTEVERAGRRLSGNAGYRMSHVRRMSLGQLSPRGTTAFSSRGHVRKSSLSSAVMGTLSPLTLSSEIGDHSHNSSSSIKDPASPAVVAKGAALCYASPTTTSSPRRRGRPPYAVARVADAAAANSAPRGSASALPSSPTKVVVSPHTLTARNVLLHSAGERWGAVPKSKAGGAATNNNDSSSPCGWSQDAIKGDKSVGPQDGTEESEKERS